MKMMNDKRNFLRMVLIFTVTLMIALVAHPPTTVEALWFFQNSQGNGTQAATTSRQQQPIVPQAPAPVIAQKIETTDQQVATALAGADAGAGGGGSSYGNYGSAIMSIAGIQPSSIASILNTVGDTGFRYFNIQDQCRNRAACDLGYMLYKRLSFVHNWLIRTSVRSLTDMNNVYTQSWMEGMLGRNCTNIYTSCRQSPLEGIMNLALLQHAFTR